jgi:predicted 2-oxoglutarate/Fe(II)-dependent dioxygenase YbiX
MFNITKLALLLPGFLKPEECDSLIREYEQRNEEAVLEHSKNYHTNQVDYSSFKVVPLQPKTDSFNFIRQKSKEVVDIYLNYLDEPKFFFTDSLKKSLRFSHNYRIMKYETDASIHPHSDHDAGIYGSLTFNLNEDYEGGEFKFFNGNYTVPLSKGDALIFPADYFWVHEVSPVTKGSRYSINSFLGDTPNSVREKTNYLKYLINNDYIQNISEEYILGPYN